MELRGLLRRFVEDKTGLRVLEKGGGDIIGILLDLNQKGFRVSTKQVFKPGTVVEGLIEDNTGGDNARLIPFAAKCVWQRSSEAGFAISEVPISEEANLDALVDKLSRG